MFAKLYLYWCYLFGSDDSDASSNLFSGQKSGDISHDVPNSIDAAQSPGIMLISTKPLQGQY